MHRKEGNKGRDECITMWLENFTRLMERKDEESVESMAVSADQRPQ